MTKALLLATTVLASLTTMAQAADMKVCVSWSNFREERWKTDEAAIKGALDAAGAEYISADAQTSATKQLADIEGMITQGCSALIVLAQDSASIGPALDAAADAGIPVVGYDRMIDDPRAFYLTFDNVEVGRMQARAVLEAMPKGRYVMIKGSPVDPNADFLRGGQQEVLQAAIDAGDITIVGEAYTDDWQPANAQKNMEQILTETDNGVDAVVASNDGTAGGVVAALTAQGMGPVPRSRIRDGPGVPAKCSSASAISVSLSASKICVPTGTFSTASAPRPPARLRPMPCTPVPALKCC